MKRLTALMAGALLAFVLITTGAASSPDKGDNSYTPIPKPGVKENYWQAKGCSSPYTRKIFHVVARKIYTHGDSIITRHEKQVIRRVIRCQRTAKSNKIVRHHMVRYKRHHARRWYWDIEWAKVPAWLKNELGRIRYCESTNNYRATNGIYTGAYQYGADAWSRAGGSGQAMDASPREQDVRTAWFYPSHRGEWECKA